MVTPFPRRRFWRPSCLRLSATTFLAFLFVAAPYVSKRSNASSPQAQDRAKKLVKQASDARLNGNYRRVLELCNQAAAIAPEYRLTYVFRGLANENLDKPQAALADYRTYRRLLPPGDVAERRKVDERIRAMERLIGTAAPTPKTTAKPAATPFAPVPLPSSEALPAPPALPTPAEIPPTLSAPLPPTALQSVATTEAAPRGSGATHSVTAAAWSPDGTRVALGSWSNEGASTTGEIRIYALSAGGLAVGSAPGDGAASSDLGLTPAAPLIGRSRFAWDYRGGPNKPPWLGHHGRVSALAWSPDGTLVVSGGVDGALMLWSADGKALRVLRAVAPESQVGREIIAVSWSSASDVCALDSGGMLRSFKRAGGRAAWVGGEFSSFAPRAHVAPGVSGAAWVMAAAFSREGSRLAAGDAGGAIGIYNLAGNRLQSFNNSEKQQMGANGIPVNALAWSPDGTQLASANFSHVYFNALPPEVSGVAASADASRPKRYDTPLFRTKEKIGALSWSLDNRLIVARSASQLFLLDTRVPFETTPLGPVRPLPLNLAPRIALSPRGDVLLDGGSDGSWRLLK